MKRLLCAFPLLLLCSAALDPPKVVSLSPANRKGDVDPTTSEVRVTFDRDMSTAGFSFCGGGPTFPKMIGQPRWIDKRTCMMGVKLQPNQSYVIWLNTNRFRNFRSTSGTPLAPLQWTFSTASKSKQNAKALNAKSTQQLKTILQSGYSYAKTRGINWNALFEKHRSSLEEAKSTSAWIRKAGAMLSGLRDRHIWFDYREAITGTNQPMLQANFHLEGVKALFPKIKQNSTMVFSARTSDGIGYLLITGWNRKYAKKIAAAQDVLRAFRECKGLILDVRPNTGGDEMLAREVAAWFVPGKKAYAKHVFLDPSSSSGFGPEQSRVVEGNRGPSRFDKPVAVLMGGANMSSCEAFLLMMKQAPNAILVGSCSAGSSGNPRPHRLANGATVYIPSWKALKPDGTCLEGEGIPPDIKVEAKPVQFRKGDPVIEKALEMLQGK